MFHEYRAIAAARDIAARENKGLITRVARALLRIRETAMPEHTITNTGPTSIKVTCTDGVVEVLDPGSILTGEIQRIDHEPKGRVEYTVRPRGE